MIELPCGEETMTVR